MAFLHDLIVGGGGAPPVGNNIVSNDPVYPGSSALSSIYNPFTNADANSAKDTSADAYGQQQALVNALQSQNGIGNQSLVFGQQQALANQLQGVANGTGPNPVLNQFNQATGQNIAAQSALMAGQRGASSNVGLLARQIAQQGANTQQQAAGQSATLQSQQQMAGLSALQNQQSQLAAGANQQAANQFNSVVGLNQTAQQNQNLANTALNAQNTGNINMQSNINASNAGVASAGAAAQGAAVGGIASGVGAALAQPAAASTASAASAAAAALYKGGMVESPERYAKGGEVKDGPRSHVTHFMNKTVAAQPNLPATMLAAQGGQIPGKAMVGGNSLKNDVVPAVLSPKEIVIPRSITMGKNAPEKAAAFVAQVLAQQNAKKRA